MNPRRVIGDWLWLRTIRKHGSRMGWRMAPPYTRYWRQCRAAYDAALPPIGDLSDALDAFRRDGVSAFRTPETTRVAAAMMARIEEFERTGARCWLDDANATGNQGYAADLCADFPEIKALFHGQVGRFLQSYFGCDFKIFHGLLYKSTRRSDMAVGSARWHSDAGPGSCVNIMFYLQDTDGGSGALSVLPWPLAKQLFAGERRATQQQHRAMENAGEPNDRLAWRDVLCDYYEAAIARDFAGQVIQPVGGAGLVVPFLNNALHRGGFPDPGRIRHAIVFHCYPADRPMAFERYAKNGLAKGASYPADPAESF